MRQIKCLILMTVMLMSRAVYADAGAVSPERPCHGNAPIPVCSQTKHPSADTLRTLLLKNAVQNGDLAPNEANEPAPRPYEAPLLPPGYLPSDAAPGHDSGKPGHYFWRQQQQRSLPPPPPDDND